MWDTAFREGGASFRDNFFWGGCKRKMLTNRKTSQKSLKILKIIQQKCDTLERKKKEKMGEFLICLMIFFLKKICAMSFSLFLNVIFLFLFFIYSPDSPCADPSARHASPRPPTSEPPSPPPDPPVLRWTAPPLDRPSTGPPKISLFFFLWASSR